MVKTDENGLGGGGWGCSECKLCKVDLKLENIEAEWHSKQKVQQKVKLNKLQQYGT